MNNEIRKMLATCGGLAVEVNGLSDDADLYRAGLKSQACVELMLALEDRFEIEFPDELLTRSTFRSIKTIEKAVSAMREAVAE